MKKLIRYFFIFALIITLAACIPTAPADVAPVSTEGPGAPGELDIIVFYTNDEHGWMEGEEESQGAANLAGLWDAEEIGSDDIVLVLSGGDNWTGPAISTWVDGQSMVEVMNAIGYDASTIGNHEFDFGLEMLQARLAEASFPYLSAKMRYKDDNQVPTELGIEPYTIIEEGGLGLGIIGLTTTLTPDVTMPIHVADFDFIDYEEALRQYVPDMRSAGADLIFVISHVCTGELKELSKRVEDLDIHLMGGGHCHERFADQLGDTVIISGGSNYRSYAYARLTYDLGEDKVVERQYDVRENRGGKPDQEIAEVVARWREISEDELNAEIGFLENEIPQRSRAMQDLTTETWLIGYPAADIAITNLGGMRDRIPEGWITLSHIISVMPFDNQLVDVTLTGEQLLQVLDSVDSQPALGGIRKRGGEWVLKVTGAPLDMQKTYGVLVTDFLYYGGDGFGLLAEFDPEAYNTGIDWRQPVIDWVSAQNSSPENPLDPAIEGLVE